MASPGQDTDHRSLTQRDLDHTPDDGNRYELIDGVLHVTPFPTTAHQQVQTELLRVLANHVGQHGLGRVFAAGLKVVLDDPTGVGPDIVFIATARLGGLKADGYYGAPDLLIEILSSKPALDLVVKKDKYARAGVPHYWIVDPDKKRLSAFVFSKGRYRLVDELEREAVFCPELFPGLEIDLGTLWY